LSGDRIFGFNEPIRRVRGNSGFDRFGGQRRFNFKILDLNCVSEGFKLRKKLFFGRLTVDATRGEVDEEELEKLHNFVQFALALMQLSGPQKWTQAKFNAELMDYLKEQK